MLERRGKLVDKHSKKVAQTLELITPSTIGLLEISHASTLMRFFSSALPQAAAASAHAKNAVLSLLGKYFYSLSPTPTKTTKLNKGFVV